MPSGEAANPQAIIPAAQASTPRHDAVDAGVLTPEASHPNAERTDCGQLELTAERETVLKSANLLVVFDRSTSMDSSWEGTPKYQAAGKALLAALTPLRDQLTVGGVFFPSTTEAAPPQAACPNGCEPGNLDHWLPSAAGCCLSTTLGACNVNPIASSDQIDFTTAEAFGRALPARWQLPGATGTPLEAGIMRAAEAIAGRHFTEPLLVVVMTDGEPNCGTDEQRVIDQVAAWRKNQITTYVIGLPGAKSAEKLLTTLAQAGGGQNYIEPRDPKELEARLRAVLSGAVPAGWNSCSFHLEPKAAAPAKLRLFVTENGHESEVPRAAGQDSQWSVNAAGDQVELQGRLCARATAGDIAALRFVFGCPEAPPPPLPELQ